MARIAYADPPYPGQSAKHYSNHKDYGGEVDHADLVARLAGYDGFVLHTSSVALSDVLRMVDTIGGEYRVMAWVKPFAVFKRNVSVAYAWEPVIVRACRKPVVAHRIISRDWVSEPITLKRGVVGAKPDAVCRWAFEVVGAEPDDDLDDLYPGSGSVMRAWRAWSTQLTLLRDGRGA